MKHIHLKHPTLDDVIPLLIDFMEENQRIAKKFEQTFQDAKLIISFEGYDSFLVLSHGNRTLMGNYIMDKEENKDSNVIGFEISDIEPEFEDGEPTSTKDGRPWGYMDIEEWGKISEIADEITKFCLGWDWTKKFIKTRLSAREIKFARY